MVPKLGEAPEHPCKVKRVETELDKISSLPEHLVDHILLHLPITDAVRTSILSKNWKYKWATIPSLVFDRQSFPYSSEDSDGPIENKLVTVIDHVIGLHSGPIQKFKLSHKDCSFVAADVDRWIDCISGSLIQELVLDVWKGVPYNPPSCLFYCQNLTHLELYNCSLKSPPTFKGFKNLKTLDIQEISIDQDVFEHLICSCPLLETLILFLFYGFTDLNIDAPNLKLFHVGGAYHDVSFKNTSNLTSIFIALDENIAKHIHVEPKAGKSSSKILRFFTNLPHIQRLEVQTHFLEYLAIGNIPSSLPNKCLDLTHLCICIHFNDLRETEAAICLLRSSPNLRELEITAQSSYAKETYTDLWRNNLSSLLFTHLRVVKVFGIDGQMPEVDFINLIISNALELERMTIKPASGYVRSELVKELLRFSRASPHVEIVYLDPYP